MISEVVNLWRGNWAAGKSVNDVDWGVGSKLHRRPFPRQPLSSPNAVSIKSWLIIAGLENKIVTASPNGNFMIFDVVKGKFGKSAKS